MSTIGAIDGGANVNQTDTGDIFVKSNGSPFNAASIDGKSTAVLQSTGGAITLEAKIDGQSTADLTAATSVLIEGKIDGKSVVSITAGGDVTIKEKIDGKSNVTIIAGGDILIEDKIDGGSETVLNWKGASLNVVGGVNGGATVTKLP